MTEAYTPVKRNPACEPHLSEMWHSCQYGTQGCIIDHGATELTADFQSHHIQGFANAARQRGLEGYFATPLISPITDKLLMGGCIEGVKLPDDIDVVVSLYPWERFRVGPNTEVHEFKMFDADQLPDIEEPVRIAVEALKAGKRVLIHCQAGLNRSGLVTATVLQRTEGMSGAEAIALLREKRCDMVLCNRLFESYVRTSDLPELPGRSSDDGCRCWNEGQWGRVHREDCPIHKEAE